MILLAGSSHPQLARRLTRSSLLTRAKLHLSHFPNGEKNIRILTPLQHQPVVILQSFSPPIDEHIIELALLTNAAKHLGAFPVIALIPWFGYSPQHQIFTPGQPNSFQVIITLLQSLGVDHLLTFDLHSPSSLTAISLPTTHLSALPLFTRYLKPHLSPDHIVVAPDAGSLVPSQKQAQLLHLPLATFTKTRRSNSQVSLQLTSGSIAHQHVLVFDDFTSTGNTLLHLSRYLAQHQAQSLTVCITHAFFVGDSASRFQASFISRFITTDTYPTPEISFPKLTRLSVAPTILEALQSLN